MSQPFYSFGTSRGGTTFLARIMSLNPEVKIASDPFLPLFRSFRTAVMRAVIDPAFDATQPLNNYYHVDRKITMMKALQAASLDQPFDADELPQLHDQLRRRMSLADPSIIPFVDGIVGDSYYDLFTAGHSALEACFDAKNARFCGSNDNWVIEFLPLLARAFADARFIIVIRDPRGAMASAMKHLEKSPEVVPRLYSFAQHWRKHAAFACALDDDPSLTGRLHAVRYESFVAAPEDETRKVCDFLGVDYVDEMLDTRKFRPIQGDQWTVYSNFDRPSQGIFTDSIDSWRQALDPGVVEFIEFVCDPEMRLFGYEPEVYHGGHPSPAVMEFLREDDRRAMGWRNDHADCNTEHALEMDRKQMLKQGKRLFDTADIERKFLFPKVFDKTAALVN